MGETALWAQWRPLRLGGAPAISPTTSRPTHPHTSHFPSPSPLSCIPLPHPLSLAQVIGVSERFNSGGYRITGTACYIR